MASDDIRLPPNERLADVGDGDRRVRHSHIGLKIRMDRDEERHGRDRAGICVVIRCADVCPIGRRMAVRAVALQMRVNPATVVVTDVRVHERG